MNEMDLGWVFEAALILAGCVVIALLLLGSIFGFTRHSERRRKHRSRRRRARHRTIDILREDPERAAEPVPEPAREAD